MTVAYGLYFMTSVEAISGLGQLIGRGALISVILVLFFLPMCLMLFDRWIVKSDYAEKKHAKMNKIRATKIKAADSERAAPAARQPAEPDPRKTARHATGAAPQAQEPDERRGLQAAAELHAADAGADPNSSRPKNLHTSA